MGCYAGLSPPEHLWPDWQGINPQEAGKQWLKWAWDPTPGCGAGCRRGGRAPLWGDTGPPDTPLKYPFHGSWGLRPATLSLGETCLKNRSGFFCFVFVPCLGPRGAEDVRNSTAACCEFLTEKGFGWQPSAVGRLGSGFKRVRSEAGLSEMMRAAGTGGSARESGFLLGEGMMVSCGF